MDTEKEKPGPSKVKKRRGRSELKCHSDFVGTPLAKLPENILPTKIDVLRRYIWISYEDNKHSKRQVLCYLLGIYNKHNNHTLSKVLFL